MYYHRIQVVCDSDFTEIFMAEIAEAGFDTFTETENGFEAYAEEDNLLTDVLDDVKERYKEATPFVFTLDKVEKQNWNEEWEKNVDPIFVEDQCLVRAEFHKIEKKYPYEIIITPKMSFGTGHHQTTYLMIKNQLQFDHKNKRVMDAGCGTAILAIMASKLGATEVEAFDIDEWSVPNGQENIDINHSANVHIYQGKISDMNFTGKFDIVLANINKNVLLAEIKDYAGYLADGGKLLLSGFYTTDVDDLRDHAKQFGLSEVRRDEKETWAALLLSKS